MRFQQFVENYVAPILLKDPRVQVYSTALDGGWEGWLQVEIFSELYPEGVVFTREPTYPGGSNKRADFNFVSATSPEITVWVELKTQRLGSVDRALAEFLSDIDKINDFFPRGGPFYAGAVVAIPNGGSREILEYARAQLAPHVSLPDIRFAVPTIGGVDHGTLFDDPSSFPDDPGAPVLLYDVVVTF